MTKTLIYGAGSIGNHLAHGCRGLGWDVWMTDVDQAALDRTQNDIYPTRYGKWDTGIRLCTLDRIPQEKYDVVILGTPPDSHMPLAMQTLQKNAPKVLLIEKPLCTPSLEGCEELRKLSKDTGTQVLVGYNHTLTQNTVLADQALQEGFLGKPITLTAAFREHWQGIFNAHPWLDGPQDTYLGYSERGGGAGGEHSHAMNIWQHFSHSLGMGRITEVSAMLDFVEDGKARYDRICQVSVKTEKGLVGNIVQDVITLPSTKKVRIQGSKGYLEWQVNFDKNKDAIRWGSEQGSPQETLVEKTRPDDFKGEVVHVKELLEGKTTYAESPISLERGLDTMMVVAASYVSHKEKRTIKIDYSSGYRLESLR